MRMGGMAIPRSGLSEYLAFGLETHDRPHTGPPHKNGGGYDYS